MVKGLHGKVTEEKTGLWSGFIALWSDFTAAQAIFHRATGPLLALWHIPIYNKYITFCVHHSSTF